MQLSQQKKELSMLRDRELKYNKRLKEYNVTAIIGSINTFMSDYMEHTAIPDIQGFDNAINECISKLNSIRQRINYIEQYRKSYMDADNAFKRFRQNNVNYEQQLSMLRELDDMPDYDITELNAQLNNIRSGMELCSNTINEYNSRLNSKENELDELSSYESQLNGLEADYETLLANYNNLLKAKDYLEKARISYAKKYQAPVNAKFNATSWLSNLGHKTPGVSNNSILSLILIHCFCFVTPGLFPTPAVVLFEILFIKDDFPTFGIPSTIALIFLPILPLFA